jgi:hypothetical protein
MPEALDIPTFAIVGDPNDGKTTLASTLAEDDTAAIDARAGTTKRREVHDFVLRGRPVLRFIDTPGFENTPQLRHWFEAHARESGDLAERFIAEHEGDPRYQPECEILRAIQGAAVIFVVDGSRAITEGDRDRTHILRLCSANRVAVINQAKSAEPACLEAWRDLLSKGGLTPLEFDAHHVSFAERMELLETIAAVMPAWRTRVKEAAGLLREAWEGRLLDARNYLMAFIEEAMTTSTSAPVSSPAEVEAATAKATDALRERLRGREDLFRRQVRKLFRHTRADWQLPEMDVLGGDLFSDQVWRLFGLNKQQLIWAGALMGLAAGGAVDLMLAGHSLLLPTLILGAAGAVTGWLTAGKSIRIKTPHFYLGNVRLPGATVQSSQAVEAGAHPQSNLLWILLDRGLGYIRFAAAWSHGRRQEAPLEIPRGDTRIGATTQWGDADKRVILQWIADVRGNRPGAKSREAAEGFLLGQVKEASRGH